jgi:hypothetical protein
MSGDIIFLDIDGVMNTRSSRENGDHLPTSECLENLSFIMAHAYKPSIVLSSTWRLDPALLEALKPHLPPIFDCTPDLERSSTGDRVDEILKWLQEHTAPTMSPAWVAIDDLDLLRMNPKLNAANFVRTSDGSGLTRACAEDVLNKLSCLRRSDVHVGSVVAPFASWRRHITQPQ